MARAEDKGGALSRFVLEEEEEFFGRTSVMRKGGLRVCNEFVFDMVG